MDSTYVVSFLSQVYTSKRCVLYLDNVLFDFLCSDLPLMHADHNNFLFSTLICIRTIIYDCKPFRLTILLDAFSDFPDLLQTGIPL